MESRSYLYIWGLTGTRWKKLQTVKKVGNKTKGGSKNKDTRLVI